MLMSACYIYIYLMVLVYKRLGFEVLSPFRLRQRGAPEGADERTERVGRTGGPGRMDGRHGRTDGCLGPWAPPPLQAVPQGTPSGVPWGMLYMIARPSYYRCCKNSV